MVYLKIVLEATAFPGSVWSWPFQQRSTPQPGNISIRKKYQRLLRPFGVRPLETNTARFRPDLAFEEKRRSPAITYFTLWSARRGRFI